MAELLCNKLFLILSLLDFFHAVRSDRINLSKIMTMHAKELHQKPQMIAQEHKTTAMKEPEV